MSFLLLVGTPTLVTLLVTHLALKWSFTGITGGIATGKSSTTSYLRTHHNMSVVDFDELSRKVVQPGKPLLNELIQEFGDDILNHDGTLNRPRLSATIFGNNERRKKMNALYKWPLLGEFLRTSTRLFLSGSSDILLDVPLLFESGMDRFCRSTLVVTVDEKEQIERLMNRDHITEEMAERRIQTQWPMERKIRMADDVLDNSCNPDEYKKRVDQWVISHRERYSSFPSLLIPSLPSVMAASTVGVFTSALYSILPFIIHHTKDKK